MNTIYKQGDIVLINLSPTSGHEQSGSRPAIVMWNDSFLKYSSSICLVIPITSTIKEFPTRVKVETLNNKIEGYALIDQARVLDLEARNAKLVDHLTSSSLSQIKEILIALIQ